RQTQAGEQKADRGPGQDGVRHRVTDQTHATQHQKNTDRRRAQGERKRANQRPSHKFEIGERSDQIVVQHRVCLTYSAATAQVSAVSLKASHMRRALFRFSTVSASRVGPQATGSRASNNVSGKIALTRSASWRAASTVRPSRCQRCTSVNNSAEVRASIAAKGSSSKIRGASWVTRRAKSMRCICPPESVPIWRRSN